MDFEKKNRIQNKDKDIYIISISKEKQNMKRYKSKDIQYIQYKKKDEYRKNKSNLKKGRNTNFEEYEKIQK